MSGEKLIEFPNSYMSLPQAISIVEFHLGDTNVFVNRKVQAIEMVVNMETHNSIKKDTLVGALRWIFDHYDFET